MAKKKKPSRRTKSRAAKAKAARLFSRAPSFPRASAPSAPSGSWQRWAAARQTAARTENERRKVVKLLMAYGVASDIADQIAYEMQPERPYLLRIWGYAGSDPDDPGSPGDMPVLQATFVGNGAENWSRAIEYAKKAPIDYVEINELEWGVSARPLWDQDSVETIEGERVYGHGRLEEYRDRQKEGRPKKAGGGMTAAERRKDRQRKNAAIKRKQKTDARIAALKDKDPIAAQRLKDRSKKARKVIP